MRKEDFDAFAQMLDDCYALLGRQSLPTQTAKAMFFRAMASHDIQTVAAAFDAHIKDPVRGKFAPSPSDLIAQIEGFLTNDGRPGAEEAWAMVVRAFDESETIVWTQEMALARQIAQPIMDMGDEVGARMAFKESYSRLIESARKERKPAEWSASIGLDVNKRQSALMDAEMRGLLPVGESLRLAPPQTNMHTTAALLLQNASQSTDPQAIKDRVAALKSLLTKKEPKEFELSERLVVAFQKCKAAQSVDEYMERNK